MACWCKVEWRLDSEAERLTDAEIELSASLVGLPVESAVARLLLHSAVVRLLEPRLIRVPKSNHTLL